MIIINYIQKREKPIFYNYRVEMLEQKGVPLTMKNKSIVALTSLMIISLICSICSAPLVFALPPDPNYGKKGECFVLEGNEDMTCC
jgi:hypothetical protein